MSGEYISGLRNVRSNFNSIDTSKDGKLDTTEIATAIKNQTISPEGSKFLEGVLYNKATIFNKITTIEDDGPNISANDLKTLEICTDGRQGDVNVAGKALFSQSKEVITSEDIKRNLTSKKATKEELTALINTYCDLGTKGKTKDKLLPSGKNLPEIRDVMFVQTPAGTGSYKIDSNRSKEFLKNIQNTLTILGYAPKSDKIEDIQSAFKSYQNNTSGKATGNFGYHTWKSMMENLSELSGDNKKCATPFNDLDD